MEPPSQEAIQFPHQNESKTFTDNKLKVQGRWTNEEHLVFLNAIIRYGKDWRKVQQAIENRTGAQVRSHAQKYFLKINKIIKDRKKIKGKKMPEKTQTQSELKQYFAENPLPDETPKEIIQLLRIQKIGIKQIILENCNSQKKVQLEQLLAPNIKSQKKKNNCCNKNAQSLPKSEQMIPEQLIADFQDVPDEESSFLNSFVRRNISHFMNGGKITAFIDFGLDKCDAKREVEEQQTAGTRKMSFQGFESLQCQKP